MKKIFFLFLLAPFISPAQEIISLKETRRIITTLASDEMKGRLAPSPEIDKAADFLAAEFKAAGLQPLKGTSFLQEFNIYRPKQKMLKAEMDGVTDPKDFMVITKEGDLKVTETSGYQVVNITAGKNLFTESQNAVNSGKNTIVLVDTSFRKNFPRLSFFRRSVTDKSPNTVFILSSSLPSKYTIKAEHDIEKLVYKNVVGVLPGKSRTSEYVIFSGHYDHIGVGRPLNGDSIYNGANDDAAGTTAVVMLARHFAKLKNNERSLIFVAFTAEETGGFGSKYFSEQLTPDHISAMFNIEMIGTESKWGKNSAFITGFERSNLGAIMQNNLKGSAFTFHPDPYPDEDLFYRSDNATLAHLGVPAHTISTAKMDSEPHYHKPSDEVSTLDLQNMVKIIEAIAVSSRSIVAGKDTPTRVTLPKE